MVGSGSWRSFVFDNAMFFSTLRRRRSRAKSFDRVDVNRGGTVVDALVHAFVGPQIRKGALATSNARCRNKHPNGGNARYFFKHLQDIISAVQKWRPREHCSEARTAVAGVGDNERRSTLMT
jgi:hypothetical protein